MPLDKILTDFGVKRKAICITPTRCRFCKREFLDKWYKGEQVHKVRCEHCGLINAKINIDDYMKVQYQGLRYDIGTAGGLGSIPRDVHFKKLVKEAYGFSTDEEVEAKLKEYEYALKYKKLQEQQVRESKITIKHKGEEERVITTKRKKSQ